MRFYWKGVEGMTRHAVCAAGPSCYWLRLKGEEEMEEEEQAELQPPEAQSMLECIHGTWQR